MEENGINYIYPKEKLDEYIQMLDQGIELMLPDQIMLEIEMRRKELHNQLFEDDDEDEDDVYVKMKHDQMMREHLQKEAKKARKDDLLIIQLSDEQKNMIRDSVETSYVRPNPNSNYNLTDDEIFENAEQKLILEKLSKLRSAYYTQADYQNAINIIRTAIEYSLEHDYPWMTKQEAIQAFVEGKIKFTYCRIPQLRLNFKDIVKDPNILAGVANGQIELVKKEDKEFKKKSYKNSPLVSIPTNVMSQDEQNYYLEAHRHGLATPISSAIQARNTIYDRYSFNIGNKKNDKFNGLVDKDGNPITFDWTQDNAAEKYMMLRNNKIFGISELVALINKENNGVNGQLSTRMSSYLAAINSSSLSHDERIVTDNQGYKQQNEDIIKTEQRIFAKIQSNIINK